MKIETIAETALQLKKTFDESEPEKLAEAMNILVSYEAMGFQPDCVKGFFICAFEVKHITVNSDLPENLQRIVLAHELGHAVLHSDLTDQAAFHEIALFDSAEQTEYEANIFAAELLLPDEEVLEILNDDLFFAQAAAVLNVPEEVLDFKFRIMKRRGYQISSPEITAGNFMKNL